MVMAAATSTKMPVNWARRSMRNWKKLGWAPVIHRSVRYQKLAPTASRAVQYMAARIHLAVAWSLSRAMRGIRQAPRAGMISGSRAAHWLGVRFIGTPHGRQVQRALRESRDRGRREPHARRASTRRRGAQEPWHPAAAPPQGLR